MQKELKELQGDITCKSMTINLKSWWEGIIVSEIQKLLASTK